MDFATNQFDLVDGQWRPRTVDVSTILRHFDDQDNHEMPPFQASPVLGLLTQTVIPAPLTNWILPLKARHPDYEDVAFIGDGFVQIKELRPDGRLWDVARKDNFGARIRNARVYGTLKTYDKDFPPDADDVFGTPIKDEADNDVDIDMTGGHYRGLRPGDPRLPPQMIVLQLESNDTIFLMLRKSESGEWRVVSNRHRLSNAMHRHQPGMHLAIDPSSRYIAVGCAEGSFSIQALYPRQELNRQYTQGSTLNFVESERRLLVQGVIIKMEFLYPSADDDQHIILLVIQIYKGKTRMLLYEWTTGGDLKKVHAHNRKGHSLAEGRQVPLLLIPLMIKSSFIVISESSLEVCNDILIGSPQFREVDSTIIDSPTSLHHGTGTPLWTAWARPERLPYYNAEKDCVYIVREDGLIRCLELHTDDDLIQADMNIGYFSSNCGAALASLNYKGTHGRSGDYLITGGDSGTGAAYLIKARESPIFQQHIPNWSPANDLVTTSRDQDGDSEPSPTSRKKPSSKWSTGKNSEQVMANPDQIFACVGKGSNGAVVEIRHGLEAHVGLDMDFEAPIENAWVLSLPNSLADKDGSLILVSTGRQSALLLLSGSGDTVSVIALNEEDSDFDLRFRTITADMHGDCKIQVTEKSIVYVDGLSGNRHIYEGVNIFGVLNGTEVVGVGIHILHAVIYDDIVLYTTEYAERMYLLILRTSELDSLLGESTSTYPTQTLGSFSNITCLATGLVGEGIWGIVAENPGTSLSLTFQSLCGANSFTITLPESCEPSGTFPLGTICSIVVVPSSNDKNLLLLCGTSNGYALTLEIDVQSTKCVEFLCDHIGISSVLIRRDKLSSSRTIFLAICDSKVYSFTFQNRKMVRHNRNGSHVKREIHRVFFTSILDSKYAQPDINAVAKFPSGTSGGVDDTFLCVSGSILLIFGLSDQPNAVLRRIPVGGTPSRLYFSHNLQLLVVAANIDKKSTLIFLDPETGEDVSKPYDKKTGTATDFIYGLGNKDEKIHRLAEWQVSKDTKKWNFIILCTNLGQVLLISVERESHPSSGSLLPKLRYYTRHKFKSGEPIYSVTSYADGIIYCTGRTLHLDVLDLAEKRLKTIAEFEISSPATNLVYKEPGEVYALTATHSLEILRIVGTGENKQFLRTHGDQVARDSLHHRILCASLSGEHSMEFSSVPDSSQNQSLEEPTSLRAPLHLVSDKSACVAGLWAISNTKADTLETIFEAELLVSIIKLRYGNCRPIWDPTWSTKNEGNMHVATSISINTAKYPEILGIAIDGSLFNFTILDQDAWRFLRFLVNIAKQSSLVCELDQEEEDLRELVPSMKPKTMMHIDGDILRRCLDGQYLEELLLIHETTDKARKVQALFKELLSGLHRSSFEAATRGRRSDKNAAEALNGNHSNAGGVEVTYEHDIEDLVLQAYKDLEYFLRPVI